MRKLLIGLVFLFLPAVAAAQTATVLANAPIFVTPVVTQSPLRVAAAGTTLQVLDDRGEWRRLPITIRSGVDGSKVVGETLNSCNGE